MERYCAERCGGEFVQRLSLESGPITLASWQCGSGITRFRICGIVGVLWSESSRWALAAYVGGCSIRSILESFEYATSLHRSETGSKTDSTSDRGLEPLVCTRYIRQDT